MYITLMYQKFSILTYFCMKIFIFRHGLLTAGLAKTTAHRVLFLVSMDSQRSEKFDGSHFWALGCLLTASGWLKSIQGHNGPALTLNVILEPDRNRVKNIGNKIFGLRNNEIYEHFQKTTFLRQLNSRAHIQPQPLPSTPAAPSSLATQRLPRTPTPHSRRRRPTKHRIAQNYSAK